MVINLNPFTIDTYTNYQPGGIGSWGWRIAPSMQHLPRQNRNTYTTGYFGSISSKFEYGIDMQAYYRKDQSANNVTLKNVTTWATTFSFVNPQDGYTYGGGYRSSTSSGSPTYPVENVATFGSTPLLTGDMKWQYDSGLLLYVINIDFKGTNTMLQSKDN